MSFIAPEATVWSRTPIFSIRPATLMLVKMTPMLPVTVVGLAMISSPASADVVAARGGDIHHLHQHRHVVLGFEAHQAVVDDVAGR